MRYGILLLLLTCHCLLSAQSITLSYTGPTQPEVETLTVLCTPSDTFLECPPDTILPADSSACLAIFQYNPPTVVDDCGANLDSVLTPVLISGLGPGGAFTVGTQVEQYAIPQDSCQFTVTVQDLQPPSALCRNLTVSLDQNGSASIVPQQIDNFSTDNCQLVAALTFSLSQTQFNTTHIGPNPVWLTVQDGSGNIDTCQAIVTIPDPNVSRPDPFQLGTLTTFPNPIQDHLTLRLAGPGDCLQHLRIIDLMGRTIISKKLSGNCQEFQQDFGAITPGQYLLEVQTRKGLGRKRILVK